MKLNIKNAQLAEALKLGKIKKPEAPVQKEVLKKEKAVPVEEPKKVAPPVTPPAAEAPAAQPVLPEVKAEPKAPVKEAPSQAAPAFKREERPAQRPPFEERKKFYPPGQGPRKEYSPPARLPVSRRDLKPSEVRRPSPALPPKAATGKAETLPAKKHVKEVRKEHEEEGKPVKKAAFKEFRDVKPAKKTEIEKSFDTRDRLGLRDTADEGWRKKRSFKQRQIIEEDQTIRPNKLHIRLPITIKDLAVEMKLKASQLISKLFMQGIILTLNDFLDDETTIQLLGQEFDCEITIDTSEAKRIKITDKTIKDEILETDPKNLIIRPPVVVFMGHVDHGKTSLIDAIRKTNMAAGEAGAITQHIGAFKCRTDVGEITILDTPGHEAFSAMRGRGTGVTDIAVLVVAGDEGIREQTLEAIRIAKEANVPIVVAINKSDKPNFNAENVYRQLADHNLLPEVWGGSIITVNCSAVTGQGIKELLEMLALQAEILELKANPNTRARGTVIESEMHKGLGAVATILVQNGTLKLGDAIVFDLHYARVKTMHDEHDRELTLAGPSTPVKITGLSGLPDAGSEFIVVQSEREAKEIAQVRQEEHKDKLMQKGKLGTMESILQKKAEGQEKKILNLILRADVQGSLEALKQSLFKIETKKVDIHVISENVGQISESDIELAAASHCTIIGFHTQVESHAEPLIKQKHVNVKIHDIIYHAVDDVKSLMVNLLDKIPQETDMGTALVKAVFKSSQLGLIAGCIVTDGLIRRNHHVRLIRDKQVIWKGTISSLKRVKEDVREVSKGIECGILLNHFSDVKDGDIIQSYEITYLEQEL